MRKFLALLLAITAIVSPIGFIADASGPSSNRILNYQLRLTDAAGVAVADGVKKLKLTIYDDPTAGNQKFTACSLDGSATGTPTKVNATFTGGVASILLGSALTCDTGSAVTLPADLFNNTALYLGVTVETDAEMTPRKRIVSGGYAQNADLLDDLDTSAVGGAVAFVPVTDASGNLVLTKNLTVDTNSLFVDATGHSVGIGTTSVGAKLDVAYNDTSATGNTSYGSRVTATHSGVIGSGSDTLYGLRVSATNNSATSGTVTVYGGSFSALGGSAGTGIAYGLRGAVSGADTNYGVYGALTVSVQDSSNYGGYYDVSGTLPVGSTSGETDGIRSNLTATYSGTANLFRYGLYSNVSGRWDGSTYGLYVYDDGSNQNTVATPNRAAARLYIGSGENNSLNTFGLQINNYATNTVRDATGKYGAYISSTGSYAGGVGAPTANYTLYLDEATGADVNYTLYTVGGQSYFGGNVGIGDADPAALFTVGNGDLFQIDSTGKVTTTKRVETAGHANNVGLNLVTYAGTPAAVTGTVEGDVVWDSTNNFLYVYNGTAFQQVTAGVAGDITAVGSMTSGDAFADSTATGDWLGLGAAAGRIAFDDQATDYVNILDANVGIGALLPTSKLTVSGGDILITDGDLATPMGGFGQYENYLKYSDQINNVVWTKTGVSSSTDTIVAPDGQTTAERLSGGSSGTDGISQQCTSCPLTVGFGTKTWTGSVWLKASAGTPSATVIVKDSGSGADIGSTTPTLSTSWQRYSVTKTFTTGSGEPVLNVQVGTNAIDVWGAQLEYSSSVGVYARTQEAYVYQASTSAPAYGLVGNGSLLFDGTQGDTPTEGTGTRMMWIPAKASFRAGYVSASNWNDANIGTYSLATGYDTKAAGTYSFAGGNQSIATNSNAFVFGAVSTSSGFASVAMGSAASASGSTALALGSNVTASGGNSIVLGTNATGAATGSTAIGSYVYSGGNYTVVIGHGVDGSNLLSDNTADSLAVGFNSTVPTLYVGPSTGAGTYGKVGIGTASPSAELTVRGTVTTATLGSDLVTNGAMDTPNCGTNWTCGAGWTDNTTNIAHATGNATTLSQGITVTISKSYQIIFTVVTTTAGLLTPQLGSAAGSPVGQTVGTSSNYQIVLVANASGSQLLSFTADSNWVGTIDSVMVKEVTPTDATLILNNSNGNAGLELRSGGSGLTNSYVGSSSGSLNTTGNYNAALGYQALASTIVGNYNTAVGNQALKSLSAANSNTAIGYQALYGNTTGSTNTAIGYQTLYGNTTGGFNIGLGYRSLYSNTAGQYNIASGYNTLYSNTTGQYNIATGASTLYNNLTGSYNISEGYLSMFNNTTGNYNAAYGYRTLYANTAGYGNLATGYDSMYSNTTGYYNVAIGYQALYYNTTGYGNIAIGRSAGLSAKPTSNVIASIADLGGGQVRVTTGSTSGIANGSTVQISGTTSYNGSYVISNVAGTTFDITATFTSSQTGWWGIDTQGRYNTIIGFTAGDGLSVGDSNTFLGYNADTTVNSVTNATAIGANASVAASNSLILGSGANVGIGTNTKLSRLTVKQAADVTGITGTTTANAATTITGSSTLFLAEVGIGDRISLSSAATTYATVTAIASNTSLTVDTALGNGTSQTINVKHVVFRTDSSADANLFIVSDQGYVGIGDVSPAALLSVGFGDKFKVNTDGDVTSSFTALNGSTTANGAGTASTTLILTSAANFDIGNYVLVNSTYAKITNIVSNTLTISPALTWANSDAVTEYHIPEIGGTDTASTLANRYGRGYFIDGVVAGNGTTYYNENGITTTAALFNIDTGSNPVNFAGEVGIGTTDPLAKLTVSGGDVLVTNGDIATPFGGFGTAVNFLKYSEDLSNAAWTKTGVNVAANSVAGPDGATTADTLSGGSVSTDGAKQTTSTPVTTVSYGTKTFTGSVWLRSSSGTPSVTLKLDSVTVSDPSTRAVTLSTSWQRYSITYTYSTGTGYPIFDIQVGTNTVYVWGGQLEYASTPGVYVRTEAYIQRTSSDDTAARGLFGNGSLLLNGSQGDTPMNGSGTRLMWVPAKAALRAGTVGTTNWDDSNIGTYSAAFGNDNRASGSYSFATGNGNIASGQSSVALGAASSATTTYAVAIGPGSTASGNSSMALGANIQTSGPASFGIGSDIVSNSTGSVGLGFYVRAGGNYAMAIGHGYDNTNRLTNNTVDSLVIGFNSNVSTLYVGPSAGIGTSGKVGIGDAAPLEKLTVSGGNIFTNDGYIYDPMGGIGRYENYLLMSEAFNDASWVKTGVTTTTNNQVAPDGQSTAERLNAGASSTDNISQAASGAPATASTTWTASVWIRALSSTALIPLSINSGNETGTASDCSVTTAWRRCSVTQTFTSGSTGTATFVINNGIQGIYIWGGQLEKQSTVGIYARTDAAAITTTGRGLVAESAGPHIFPSGSVGIGDSSPASLFTVGSGDLFQVDTSGDLVKIKNVTYAWPGANAAGVLTNNGSGTLTWSAASSGDITAVGSMTSGDAFADATASGDWLGLGSGAGRIEFDDQVTDEVNILDAKVGIGTATPSARLQINPAVDPLTYGDLTGELSVYLNNPSTSYSNALVARTAISAGAAASPALGIYGEAQMIGDFNYGDLRAGEFDVAVAPGATFTVTDAAALFTYAEMSGAGTVTNLSGLRVYTNAKSAGTLTNNYGILIESQVGIGTNNWQLYSAGAGKSYFGGDLDIKGVSYTWPGANAAGVLTNNGSGTLTWTAAGDITAVGSMTSGDAFADATASGDWLGLGSGAGRIEFDDQAVDEVNILDAKVGIGTATPTAKLDIVESSTTEDIAVQITKSGYDGYTYGLFSNASGYGTTTMGLYGSATETGGQTLTNAWGVYGAASNATTNYGLYGDASGGTTNWGLYVNAGNADINGTLQVNMGTGTSWAVCKSTQAGTTNETLGDCTGGPTADYAEQYSIENGIAYGEIVAVGASNITTTQGDTLRRMARSSIAYQDNIIGIVSAQTDRGDFSSIGYNIKPEDNPMFIALNGRVTVKISDENGVVAAGDPVTTSATPGVAMRATRPGMIVGYALNDWAGPGQGEIMVFVSPGWHSGSAIGTDGALALFRDDFAFDRSAEATTLEPAKDSRSLSFRASAWDAAAASALDRTLSFQNVITDKDNYKLSLQDTNGSEVIYFGHTGDLALKGNLYPSDRGAFQTSKYIYYDGETGIGGDMMRTNAAGWGTGSYDFAEMFPSIDQLESGELVMVDVATAGSVKKADNTAESNGYLLAGIVSTKPGFIAGLNEAGTYPVALEGRVPTKVSLENGPISIGDPITVSSVPGVGMKADAQSYVVGIALESYTSVPGTPPADGESGTGLITVYLKIGWYNGSQVASPNTDVSNADTSTPVATSVLDMNGQPIIRIGALEGLDGLWSIDGNGKMVMIEVVADTVTTKETKVKITDEKKTIGRSMIPSGSSGILVDNAAIKPTSEIFVTFKKNPASSWWIDEVNVGYFVIKTTLPVVEDVSFSYWVVDVVDETTPPASVIEPPPAEEPSPTADPAPEPPPVTDPAPELPPVEELVPEPSPVVAPVAEEPVTPPTEPEVPAEEPVVP